MNGHDADIAVFVTSKHAPTNNVIKTSVIIIITRVFILNYCTF